MVFKGSSRGTWYTVLRYVVPNHQPCYLQVSQASILTTRDLKPQSWCWRLESWRLTSASSRWWSCSGFMWVAISSVTILFVQVLLESLVLGYYSQKYPLENSRGVCVTVVSLYPWVPDLGSDPQLFSATSLCPTSLLSFPAGLSKGKKDKICFLQCDSISERL